MPPGNGFRHQLYGVDPAPGSYATITPLDPVNDAPALERGLGPLGAALRRAGVRSIWLVHGTFTGTDALGLFRTLARLVPGPARSLAAWRKRAVDALVGEAGNYTEAFARELEAGLNHGNAGSRLPVRRLAWTGENHHLGRADGAVDLLFSLLEEADRVKGAGKPGRVLAWGHSHGGNVLALATNLMRATPALRRAFFGITRSHRGRLLRGRIDLPRWARLAERLERGVRAWPALDIVTFGTPVRYGWDVDADARLIHVVNHRPQPGEPGYGTRFPPRLEALLHASAGDVVQQLGVAGTDFPPPWLFLRARLANRRLARLFERGLPRERRLARLEHGTRVAADGITLLVDYGRAGEPAGARDGEPPPTGTRRIGAECLERDGADPAPRSGVAPPAQSRLGRHLAGHTVYTRREWMLFHVEEIVRRFYPRHAAC